MEEYVHNKEMCTKDYQEENNEHKYFNGVCTQKLKDTNYFIIFNIYFICSNL